MCLELRIGTIWRSLTAGSSGPSQTNSIRLSRGKGDPGYSPAECSPGGPNCNPVRNQLPAVFWILNSSLEGDKPTILGVQRSEMSPSWTQTCNFNNVSFSVKCSWSGSPLLWLFLQPGFLHSHIFPLCSYGEQEKQTNQGTRISPRLLHPLWLLFPKE